eukprot:CAMPEP_0201542892 /NCGR_PEP_ID=MMETSP0161_2-20130828/72281_1 /ASSEMBLY_ACC=CAM_ASM_000251 /TAXON_ID=180227 /ORGANISM="Neoparamoeba aestuarina, Strain SoJaBio B1-5/56/2" /LENGTH=245 /DNA_ID=CAMNT_0047950581 /DNA_START=228 /DNA_END=965 /DNA_ORIENTATION=-
MFKISTPENACSCNDNQTYTHHSAPHTPFNQVQYHYQNWKARALAFYEGSPEIQEKIQASNAYYIALLRNPIDRAISEFFHVNNICPRNGWRVMFPPDLYKSICNLDFDAFLNHDNNPVFSRQIYFFYPNHLRGEWRSYVSGGLEEVKENFSQLTMVLLNERLAESVNLFSRYFHLNRGNPDPASHIQNKNVHRKSALKLSLFANATIRERMEEKMKEDVELYRLAVSMFEKQKYFIENYVDIEG